MMVLAVAKQFSPLVQEGDESHVDLLRITCQDINPVATDMNFINTTLWGIPAKIILGNSISFETPQKIWKNIHWHRVGEDQRQEMLQTWKDFKELTSPSRKTTATTSATSQISREFEQSEFDLDLSATSEKSSLVR